MKQTQIPFSYLLEKYDDTGRWVCFPKIFDPILRHADFGQHFERKAIGEKLAGTGKMALLPKMQDDGSLAQLAPDMRL